MKAEEKIYQIKSDSEFKELLKFYVKNPCKLDRKQALHFLAYLGKVPDACLDVTTYEIQILFRRIFEEILAHLAPDYHFKFVRGDEMQNYLHQNGSGEFKDAKGITIDYPSTDLLINIDSTDSTLESFFTMVEVFAHECQHIIQKRCENLILHEYTHIIKLEDMILPTFLGVKGYYVENYSNISTEVEAFETGQIIYDQVLKKYFPSHYKITHMDNCRKIEKYRDKKQYKVRKYQGKHIFLEVLFEKKIQKEKNTLVLAFFPELKKEYDLSFHRKTTYELYLEEKNCSNPKEKRCYRDLIMQRDLSLEKMIEDYIDFAIKIGEYGIEDFQDYFKNCLSKVNTYDILYQLNHEQEEEKRILMEGIYQIRASYPIVEHKSKEDKKSFVLDLLKLLEDRIQIRLQNINIPNSLSSPSIKK